MHYLSSVHSVTIPPHVSGLLVAHHQEVTMYMRDSWYVLYVLVQCRRAWLEWTADNQLKRTKPTNCHTHTHTHIYIYTLLPPDHGQIASSKYVAV
jgi:hypothetical protein